MDKQTVEKAARLANIEITEQETVEMQEKLTTIIQWVEQLSEVDTDDVEPLANVVDAELPLRVDVVNDGDVRDKVLANAPEDTQGFYVVPKIVEQED